MGGPPGSAGGLGRVVALASGESTVVYATTEPTEATRRWTIYLPWVNNAAWQH